MGCCNNEESEGGPTNLRTSSPSCFRSIARTFSGISTQMTIVLIENSLLHKSTAEGAKIESVKRGASGCFTILRRVRKKCSLRGGASHVWISTSESLSRHSPHSSLPVAAADRDMAESQLWLRKAGPGAVGTARAPDGPGCGGARSLRGGQRPWPGFEPRPFSTAPRPQFRCASRRPAGAYVPGYRPAHWPQRGGRYETPSAANQI